jgi:hypothetical protein
VGPSGQRRRWSNTCGGSRWSKNVWRHLDGLQGVLADRLLREGGEGGVAENMPVRDARNAFFFIKTRRKAQPTRRRGGGGRGYSESTGENSAGTCPNVTDGVNESARVRPVHTAAPARLREGEGGSGGREGGGSSRACTPSTATHTTTATTAATTTPARRALRRTLPLPLPLPLLHLHAEHCDAHCHYHHHCHYYTCTPSSATHTTTTTTTATTTPARRAL